MKIEGPNAKIDGDTKSIAWWTDTDTSLHWTAKIDKPGKYRVELNFAVLGNTTHGELSIAAGDQNNRGHPDTRQRNERLQVGPGRCDHHQQGG